MMIIIYLNFSKKERKAHNADNEDDDDYHFHFLRSKIQRTRQSPTAQNCLTVLSKVMIMMMMMIMPMMMMPMMMMVMIYIIYSGDDMRSRVPGQARQQRQFASISSPMVPRFHP